AYSPQRAMGAWRQIPSECKEILGKLPVRGQWEEVEDKRLSIECAGLRQTLWEDDIPSREALAPYGDVLEWIATHLQLADCFTESMKPHLLNEMPT
ncbi:unnamed protein product, partial [Symbiodinium sp. KB8]